MTLITVVSFYQLNGDIYRSSKEYTGGFINGKYVHFFRGQLDESKSEKRILWKDNKDHDRG